MDYKLYTALISSHLQVSYGFTFKSAGKFKDHHQILKFFQTLYPDPYLFMMDQRHTTNISTIIKPSSLVTTLPTTDGLFYPNPRPYHVLITQTADCLPIVVWDKTGNIGIAHAGWQGSLNQILIKLLDYFLTDSPPENIFIFIGPSIGFCCYPIFGPRLRKFQSTFPNWASQIIIKDQNRLTLDLKKLNQLQALNLNIPVANIKFYPSCTSCQSNLFFSYVKDKTVKGNILTWVTLIPTNS